MLEQMLGMMDLARQIAEPHATTCQKRACRFDAGPETPEISLAEHVTQALQIDPEIDGKFAGQGLPLPDPSYPVTEVVAPICIDGGLNLLVSKFILLLHAATDGLGHPAGRTADRSARNLHHDSAIMPDPRVEAGKRAHESAVFARRHCRNTTCSPKRSACYR
jgi:hypothetical protein